MSDNNGWTIFISDGRYIEQSKTQVKGFKRFISMDPHLNQIKTQNLICDDLKIAFEGDHLSYSQFENMKSVFPAINWENTLMILEDLASVKDKYELDCRARL